MTCGAASGRPVAQRRCVISAGKTNCPSSVTSMGGFVMASIAGDEPIRDLADRTVRETLHGRDQIRWYDLMRMVFTYAAWKRPEPERARLFEAVRVAQADLRRQEEIKK